MRDTQPTTDYRPLTTDDHSSLTTHHSSLSSAIQNPKSKIQNQQTIDELAAALRMGTPPVVGRISEDRLLLDLRTVLPQQEDDLVAALVRALERQ